ncbi:uncharacterized protein B0P05DRAFT_435692, partial [Gilbertella persicaria]|uniref:uncharacterized protein n=1 Tax=Gilbertella persicaria TaxID=101096 RepID=UPI00221EAAF4
YTIDEKVLPLILPVHKELEQVDFQVHHWQIDDWTSLDHRAHGPIFEAAGLQWRVLLFPKGNSQHDQVSIYLEVVMDNKEKKEWSVCGEFAVII